VPPTRTAALVVLLLVQVIFGVWPVVGRVVLDHVSASVLVGVRVALAGPLILLLARPWRARMPASDVLRCAGLAVLGVATNQLLFVEGLQRSTPTNSAVLGCLTPAYTALIALLLRQERWRPGRLYGMGLALCGALVLVGVDQFAFGGDRSLGNLLFVASTLCYSSYLVLARPLIARYGPLPVMGWMFAAAVPIVLLWTAPELVDVRWRDLAAAVWGGFAYIVLGATVVAYVGVSWALVRLSASTVAVFVYLQPLVTGVAANRVLGERPGWQVALAALLIFAGIGLVARDGRPATSVPSSRAAAEVNRSS
jgi:drug/metabolite transporter (DMT)-like permease